MVANPYRRKLIPTESSASRVAALYKKQNCLSVATTPKPNKALWSAISVAAVAVSLLSVHLLTWMTSQPNPSFTAMFEAFLSDPSSFSSEIFANTAPTTDSVKALGGFLLLALFLYPMPGKVKYGPITARGVRPEYTDNGMMHCLLFTLIFIFASNEGPLGNSGFFSLSILSDNFEGIIGLLSYGGALFCLFLCLRGLDALDFLGIKASGPDRGPSGRGFCFDYYWGTELYPRICGIDVKKYVNCRFSMTFWMLVGVSYSVASYKKHGFVDPGIVLSAASQFIYLVKFFHWEIGYMRSIDIIVDRCGFYETWGCIAWVPCMYTLHTRSTVNHPSGLSWTAAGFLFVLGVSAVFFNWQADNQRMRFRETNGQALVWGKKPKSIHAEYTVDNAATGQKETHKTLLLASGWWGVARHANYFFEITVAWTWGLLANASLTDGKGLLPLCYPIFLTTLLIHRAIRDEEKCSKKYGAAYTEYCKHVPYSIIPLVF